MPAMMGWPAAGGGKWHRATAALPATAGHGANGSRTVLLDLLGMGSGFAFVNGKHVATFNLALGNCSTPRPDRCGASPIDRHDADSDGGCNQPSQR